MVINRTDSMESSESDLNRQDAVVGTNSFSIGFPFVIAELAVVSMADEIIDHLI